MKLHERIKLLEEVARTVISLNNASVGRKADEMSALFLFTQLRGLARKAEAGLGYIKTLEASDKGSSEWTARNCL